MAITIDWGTKVINVPRADLQLVQAVPTEVRQLDIDEFRLTLNDLQDDAVGMAYPTTHQHVQPISVGGVTLARIVEIINGYTITFEDGQYAVNLVGANSNIADVTNVNQVSIRSANSAGLTFSDQINDQSFQGYVWVDTNNGLPGSGFPRGTLTDPVSNWPDADVIADARNIKGFHVVGDITPNTPLSTHVFTADAPVLGSVTLDGVQGTADTAFKEITVSGTANGVTAFDGCAVLSLSGFQGAMRTTAIRGTVTVDAAATGVVRIIGCYSDVPGTGRPTVDINGANIDMSIRDYTGGLTLEGQTNPARSTSIDVDSGTVEIAASCTEGVVNVRGTVLLIDNSGPNCTVVTSGTVTELAAAGSITDADKDDIAARIIPQIWAAS